MLSYFIKLTERDHQLRRRMHVDRVGGTAVISRNAIFGEKGFNIIFKTFIQAMMKAYISGISCIIMNAFKIVTGMKIIYPLMEIISAISPCAIFLLMGTAKCH